MKKFGEGGRPALFADPSRLITCTVAVTFSCACSGKWREMAITGGGSPRCNTCTLPDYWWLPGKCHCVQLPTPPILVPLCASSESVLDPDSSTVTLSVEDFIIALCKALSQTQPQGNFPPPPPGALIWKISVFFVHTAVVRQDALIRLPTYKRNTSPAAWRWCC